MHSPSLIAVLALLTTSVAIPTPDFPTNNFDPGQVVNGGLDLAAGTEKFPNLQYTLEHTAAHIGSDGSVINYLDPYIPTNTKLEWLPLLRGQSWNPHNVPNAANITDPSDKLAYSNAIHACLDDYGKDPFLQSWQGKHCDPVTLPKSGEVINIGFFRSRTTGEYQSAKDCYEACSGFVRAAIESGSTDFVCYDFESRVRVGKRKEDGLAVLSRDTECQLGFHREEVTKESAPETA
ncbi:MAG: hypothetical protein M1835_002301 [Candelina submexicana]|nr:MAG: hypothetical protein M1835_002301 [Candelina submexicana]